MLSVGISSQLVLVGKYASLHDFDDAFVYMISFTFNIVNFHGIGEKIAVRREMEEILVSDILASV